MTVHVIIVLHLKNLIFVVILYHTEFGLFCIAVISLVLCSEVVKEVFGISIKRWKRWSHLSFDFLVLAFCSEFLFDIYLGFAVGFV